MHCYRASLFALVLALGACEEPPLVLSLPREPRDLQVFSFRPTAGGVELELPDDALGFTIASFGHVERAGPYEVVSPSGELLVDRQGILPRQPWPDWWIPGTRLNAIPMASAALPLEHGRWSLRFTSGLDRVELWVRRSVDGAFHGGFVDFDVVTGPDPSDAPAVRAALELAFPFAGLELGRVRFHRLSQPIVDAAVWVGPEHLPGPLSGPPIATPSVRLVVVESLEVKGGGSASGAASSVPGGPTDEGGVVTLVTVIARHVLDQGPAASMGVIRHELGHLGGLFHTTDPVDGLDTLDDTAECPASVLASERKTCPDADNVMFYSSVGDDRTAPRSLTPDQIAVLHGSLLYRGVLADDAP